MSESASRRQILIILSSFVIDPKENVQRMRLWRQRSLGPIVGVRYADSSGGDCASLYRFEGERWKRHELRWLKKGQAGIYN